MKNNDLKTVLLNWPQFNINEFVQTSIGNGGSDIFIGENSVLKCCPSDVNAWQRLSFLNEKFLLNQLYGCIQNVVIPKVIEGLQDYEDGFMQTKIKGAHLYDIFNKNKEQGNDIIQSSNFINSIAQFIVQFNWEMRNKGIVPLKKSSLSMINQDNLKVLSEFCPLTYSLFDKIKKEYEESSHKMCYFHNDLNLENIFIDEDGKISIIDFGETTIIPSKNALGKLFYSLGSDNLDIAWNIAQKVYELDKKNWVSPQEAIVAAILPKINTLHFNLLRSDPDIIQLTQNMENYTKGLLNQSKKYQFSYILKNFRNNQKNKDFKIK